MHVALATGSRKHLYLHRHRVDEVGDTVGGLVDIQAFHQFGVLRSDAHGTAPGMAGVWLCAERVVIFDVEGTVTVESNQSASTDRNGIRSQRQRFGSIHAAAYAAGNNQLHHTVHADFAQSSFCLDDGGQCWDAGMIHQDIRRSSRAALGSIQHDDVNARFDRQFYIIGHTRCANFDVNRDFPVGGFSQFFDFGNHIVGACPVGMAHGAALIDAGGQFTHSGNLFRNLLAQQHAARAGFGPLPDNDFQRVCHAHMMRVETVATRQNLINKLLGGFALGHQHAPVARGGRGANAGCSAAKRDFSVTRERAEAHTCDGDGRFQHNGFFREARAKQGFGGALLAIAFQRDAAERARDEGQFIERDEFFERAEATNAIAPQFYFDMHIFHHLWRPELPITNKWFILIHALFPFPSCGSIGYMATRHNSKSAFEKLCRRPPEPIFLKSEIARLWLSPYFSRVSLRKRASFPVISLNTASLPNWLASPPR